MKHLLPLILLIISSSCVMDSQSPTSIVEDSEMKELIHELEVSELDSMETEKLDSLNYSFVLIDPDTTLIKHRIDDIDFFRSELYFYLHDYYELLSRDSIQYYSYEGETDKECGFIEFFVPGIKYELADCSEEGGISETVTFPRVNNTTMKSFIQKLFENEENTWTDEFNYEADGAGCYYNVTHTDSTSTISIYCGC